MALSDLSLAGSGDSATPQAPQTTPTQQPSSTQPTSTPQFSGPPSATSQAQAAMADLNNATSQPTQAAPTYTPPTLSGQPSYFGRILQGALNGLAGGLIQGQENIAGAGSPGFVPGGNGLSYAMKLQAAQDQKQAEADKQKQDTAQQQFENERATFQQNQQAQLEKVQAAQAKLNGIHLEQQIQHADETAQNDYYSGQENQRQMILDAGGKEIAHLKVAPGQTMQDVGAEYIKDNPGLMSDPNVHISYSRDADGETEVHVMSGDPNARISSEDANAQLKSIGSERTLPPDTTMTRHDFTRLYGDEAGKVADQHNAAKVEQLKADQQMALQKQNQDAEMARTRFVQGQENSRAAAKSNPISAVDGNPLASSQPDANGVRQQYLQSLPTNVQSQVQAIGEGRMAPPNARTKIGKELADQVATAYPNYDASKQPAYQKMRNDFVSGKSAQGLNALNTAIEHLGVMADNASITSTLPGLSAIERGLGNQQANNFKAAQQAASDEVGKAYKGGVLSQHEAEEWQSQIGGWTPASAKAKATSLVGLLKGKIDSYQQQLDNGTPSGVPSGIRLTNDASQRTYDRLLGSQSNPSQSQPQQSQGVVPAGAQPARRNGQIVGYKTQSGQVVMF